MLEEVGMREEIAMLKKDLSLTLYRVKFLIVWMLCRKKEGGREGGKESLYTFLLVRFKIRQVPLGLKFLFSVQITTLKPYIGLLY
jgi:hypothetical protein